MWNISWAWPNSLEAAYEQWHFPTRNKFFKKIWAAIFQVIIWSIWKERNERVFNKVAKTIPEIQDLILLRLSWWIKPWCEPFPYSSDEIVRYPNCLNWNEATPTKLTTRQPSQLSSGTHQRCRWYVGSTSNPLNYGVITGGILMNEHNKVICVFSCPTPPMHRNNAGVIAVHRALQISINNPTIKLLPMNIEADSKEAAS